MILIKFVANSGLLSRRKSEEAIKNGLVKINGIVIKDPNYEVCSVDVVLCQNKKIVHQEMFYILLNKPVGCLTSRHDPSGLPLVFDLLPLKFRKILDPVGRLDFNTSGALLLTNDGQLAYKLTHPKFIIKKKYLVTSSRPLHQKIIDDIKSGICLADGVVKPDEVSWQEFSKTNLVVGLHSGKYRIIRRLFQELNIFVKKLHRLSFGPLKVSGMEFGSWRHLTLTEIKKLKL